MTFIALFSQVVEESGNELRKQRGNFFVLVGTGSSRIFDSFLVFYSQKRLSLRTPATKRE